MLCCAAHGNSTAVSVFSYVAIVLTVPTLILIFALYFASHLMLCYDTSYHIISYHTISHQLSPYSDFITFLSYYFPQHTLFSFLFVIITVLQSCYDLTDSAISGHRPWISSSMIHYYCYRDYYYYQYCYYYY